MRLVYHGHLAQRSYGSCASLRTSHSSDCDGTNHANNRRNLQVFFLGRESYVSPLT